jgi:hypothetical protein
MGLAHSPRIVTDGLVVALDAGNTKSYPGSGSTLYDLSGKDNDFTATTTSTASDATAGTYFKHNTKYKSRSLVADVLGKKHGNNTK